MSTPGDLQRELTIWRRNIRHFMRTSKITRKTDDAGHVHEVIRYRQVTGREAVVPLADVVFMRRRVVLLTLEARRRLRAKDSAWFHWIGEIRDLTRIGMLDDFDEVHGLAIERAVARKSQIRAASKAGAAMRRAIGKKTDERLAAAKERRHTDVAAAASISERQERRRRRGK